MVCLAANWQMLPFRRPPATTMPCVANCHPNGTQRARNHAPTRPLAAPAGTCVRPHPRAAPASRRVRPRTRTAPTHPQVGPGHPHPPTHTPKWGQIARTMCHCCVGVCTALGAPQGKPQGCAQGCTQWGRPTPPCVCDQAPPLGGARLHSQRLRPARQIHNHAQGQTRNHLRKT